MSLSLSLYIPGVLTASHSWDMQDTFSEKLTLGQCGELLTKYYFESVLGKKVTLTPGFDRSGDLIIANYPVEVKTDIKATNSGNIAIEVRSLDTHTALHYVWVVPTFYGVTRKGLEEIISVWPKTPMGDDGRDGVLLPLDSPEFKRLFKIL